MKKVKTSKRIKVAAKGAKRHRIAIKYTMIDAQGVLWRMVGARPVSEIADRVMLETGFPISE